MRGKILLYSTISIFCCNVYLIYSIVKYGETGNYKDRRAGYWGEKTANTNWCEPDYVISQYVAEFWNTASSFLIFFYGIYGIYIHQWMERRFFTALYCFLVVGLGRREDVGVTVPVEHIQKGLSTTLFHVLVVQKYPLERRYEGRI